MKNFLLALTFLSLIPFQASADTSRVFFLMEPLQFNPYSITYDGPSGSKTIFYPETKNKDWTLSPGPYTLTAQFQASPSDKIPYTCTTSKPLTIEDNEKFMIEVIATEVQDKNATCTWNYYSRGTIDTTPRGFFKMKIPYQFNPISITYEGVSQGATPHGKITYQASGAPATLNNGKYMLTAYFQDSSLNKTQYTCTTSKPLTIKTNLMVNVFATEFQDGNAHCTWSHNQ